MAGSQESKFLLEAAFRGGRFARLLRGQTGPLLTQLLLTQHSLARADWLALPCSSNHRSGHSKASNLPVLQLNLRRSLIRQLRRGTELSLALNT